MFGSLAPMHVHSFHTPTNTIPENSMYVMISSHPRDHASNLGNMHLSHSICSLNGCYSDDESTQMLQGHSIPCARNLAHQCGTSCPGDIYQSKHSSDGNFDGKVVIAQYV